MKRVEFQTAYVLHRRAYRETSFLVDLFTPDHGRLTAIAKGVRKSRSPTQGLLQPFTPIVVSWSGKGELVTLTHTDIAADLRNKQLRGECLFAGFYLNELLMSLLQKWDAHPELYTVYHQTLIALQNDSLEQKTLRAFEKYLLEALGYGLLLKSDTSRHHHYLPDQYYRFIPEQGFVLSDSDSRAHPLSNIFSGKSLLAIANEDWEAPNCLQDAKRLTRFMLAPLLGKRPIYSRKLFLKMEGSMADESAEN